MAAFRLLAVQAGSQRDMLPTVHDPARRSPFSAHKGVHIMAATVTHALPDFQSRPFPSMLSSSMQVTDMCTRRVPVPCDLRECRRARMTLCSAYPQSQRQVQRRFEAYLAGKPLPRQTVSSDSPRSASCSAASGVHTESAQHGKPAKAGKKQQASGAQPISQERRQVVDNLVSAVRDAVAACVAGGLLPEAQYPAPVVQAPSAKQAKLLPRTARCVQAGRPFTHCAALRWRCKLPCIVNCTV